MPVRSEAFWTRVLRSDLHPRNFLLLLVSLLGWLSVSASHKAPTCQPNQPAFNVTLRAGSASGTFWKLGPVKDAVRCGQLCCKSPRCDLAFSVDKFCYNVECNSEEMCRLRRGNFSRHHVAVTLVTRENKQHHPERKIGRLDTIEKQAQEASNEENKKLATNVQRIGNLRHDKEVFRGFKKLKNRNESNSFRAYESSDRGIEFESQDSFSPKTVVRLESRPSQNGNNHLETKKSGTCHARRILHRVTLRSGLKSGDFTDFGRVPDIDACVKHCCAQKNCDVSLLLNSHCYTLHCFKPEFCKIMPAHASTLNPTLAFVTRSADDQSNTRVKKKTSSSDRGPCPHGAIFSGVSLKGGRKAGKFQILAGAKDMRSCIEKCCASPSCQVAWLLGDHCYSVACYDKCVMVKKSSSSIRSQLSLLTRKPLQSGNDKRQGIPGSKGNTEKEFTLFLTITDKVFTGNLEDIESLEFLNLAEELQVAVSSVFSNDPSYQPEVISFRPGPIIAQLRLTTAAKTPASRVLKLLLDAVRAGQLKSSIDGIPISFKISEDGFRFLTSSGLNLVCSAEHDYDINWKLAMFNSTDNQICPRKVQGETSRFCAGSETANATWHEPNFSECVSSAYKTLHQETKDLAEKAEKKLAFTKEKARQIITRLEKLVFTDTYRSELNSASRADQHKIIRATKKKGTKSSKLQDKPKFIKKHEQNDKKGDVSSLPVTEIPRARPEILPISSTQKNEDQNNVWFSDPKTKQTVSNLRDKNANSKNLNQPMTDSHLVPIPRPRAPSPESLTGTESAIPVQDNRNRIPTQAPPLQRMKSWGFTANQNSVARSRVQNNVLPNPAMVRQSQINRALARAQHKNFSPIRNAYQSPNPRLVPGYPHPPSSYQWPGSQAWQGNRARYQNSWGRSYSPPSYSSDQLDIGRKKRYIVENNERQRRQNALWYNTRQYPSQNNNPANRGMIHSSTYQQPRNYFTQNAYRSSPNQVAANSFQAGYQRPLYGQSLGMGASPAGQHRFNGVAPGLRGQIQNSRYGTQPGVFSGPNPGPVERWPTMPHPLQKPTLALHSQTSPKPVILPTKSRIETNSNQNRIQNAKDSKTISPDGQLKPTKQITNKVPHVHEAPKPTGRPVQRTSGSKKEGPKNNLLKKLQDMTATVSNRKSQVQSQKLQISPSSSMKANEKHVVPMFGGDILLSVGALTLLQKFTRLSGSAVTESELKLFVNSSSHLLDLKNKQEWRNAQKHAEELYKKGINVLEDSSNWDWDESQEMTSKDTTIGPIVLDLIGTVQDFVMNASYSVSFTKPLLTENILVGVHTFGSGSSDPTQPMSFPNYSDPVLANWSTGNDSITLTPSIFDSAVLGQSVNVHLLTSQFKTISQLLNPGNDSNLVLNSAVLSSTARPAATDELIPPVKIVMSVLNSSLIKFDQQCVAWTPKKSAGEKGSEWSSKGCKMTGSNATHTTCECNHMTNFAVLADTSKAKGVGVPHPSAAVPSAGAGQDRSWIGVLFGILAVLLVIILVLLLLFYWRRKRRSQDQGSTPRPRTRGLRRSRSLSRSSARASRSSSSKSDGAASPASSHSSQFDEMIAARRRKMAQDKQEKERRAQELGDEDEDDDELLMKEKAILFSDYHQPYHFLSKEEDAARRREQPGSSRPSPPRGNRRSAMNQDGSDV